MGGRSSAATAIEEAGVLGEALGGAPEKVETALQDVGGGDAVDDVAATLAGQVGGDHLSGHCGGREALVPEDGGQIAHGEEVSRELAHRLGSRPLSAGEGQRQADDKAG